MPVIGTESQWPEKSEKSYACYGNFLASTSHVWIKSWLNVSLICGALFMVFFLYLHHVPALPSWLDGVSILKLKLALVAANTVFLGLPLFYYCLHSLIFRKRTQPEIFLLLAIGVDIYISLKVYFGQADVDYPAFYLTVILPFVVMFVASVESYAMKKSLKDLNYLYGLQPKEAVKLDKGQLNTVLVENLVKGDILIVKPSEVIPVDGKISSGATSVDESMFTGETTILMKKQGDRVTGGTINRDGTIEIEVDLASGERFLDKLYELIGGFKKNANVYQQILDTSFPLLIILVALLGSLIVMTGVFDVSHDMAWVRFLGILVAVGFFSVFRLNSIVTTLSIGRAVRHGLLLKSSDYIDTLARMDSIFMDKTGTLTKGAYTVSQVLLEHGVNQGEFLSSIFSLELDRKHPIAKGVKSHPWYLEVPKLKVKQVKENPGLGVCGIVSERVGKERFVAVGNQRFLKRNHMFVSRALREKIDELESIGETVILCGWNGRAQGLMSFADSLSMEVKPLLAGLSKLKVKPVMITGDHDEMIGNLNYAHGIEHVYTRCLPEEKAKKISNRQNDGEVVGMMARLVDQKEPFMQADIGLAIGVGTNIKDKPVEGFILGRSLRKVPQLITFARSVARAKRLGFWMSAFVSVLSLGCALGGWVSPLQLLFVMSALSLAFIAFSLAIRRVSWDNNTIGVS